MSTRTTPAVPNLSCFCATLRRASRALTQLYEDALRPSGLRATQFTILQALTLTGEIPQGSLGRILALDSTTLTRALKILRRRRWVGERRGKDRRERLLHLAPAGKRQFRRALPAWRKAQSQVRHRLGERAWKNLTNLSNQVTSVVSTEGGSS